MWAGSLHFKSAKVIKKKKGSAEEVEIQISKPAMHLTKFFEENKAEDALALDISEHWDGKDVEAIMVRKAESFNKEILGAAISYV